MLVGLETGKQIKNREQMSQILKVLVPVMLTCFCMLMTGLMGFCVEHQIGFYWSLIIMLWGTVLVFSGMFPYYINPHLPMLLGWAVWISVQSDYKLSRSTSYVALLIPNKFWLHAPLVIAPLLALVATRKLQVLLLAIAEILYLALIPKVGDVDEKIMVLQTTLYCFLYFLSLGVSMVLAEDREEMSYFVLTRVIGSVWILWIDNPFQMLILTLVYSGFCLVMFAVRFETIQRIWDRYNTLHNAQITVEDPEGKNK